MTKSTEERSVRIVLNAFDTLFNRRDYAAAERFWSPNYTQHSAHIPPGREGLFALIKGVPDNFHYENGLAVANGEISDLATFFRHDRVLREISSQPAYNRLFRPPVGLRNKVYFSLVADLCGMIELREQDAAGF